MSSRPYLRPASPTARRFDNTPRSSTGTISKPHDVPSNYTTRETYTSPRSSGDRVVPVSKETYVDGRLVESSRKPAAVDPNHYDRHHHRRSTYDADFRAPSTSSSSLRPTGSVHHDRDISPGDRSTPRDDRYSVSSNANPRREHKKIYSIDDGKATRVSGGQETRKRDDRAEDRAKPPPADRSHPYHLRGSSKTPNVDDYDAYEYTDARGMFRDTEPKWRPRRGSIDTVTRDRPSSMVEPYQVAPRTSAREVGPPVSTRGFDKVNNSTVSRHGSLQDNSRRSPPRPRGYTASSTYSDDENYRVPPRLHKSSRDDPSYYSSERGSEVTSPTRAPMDDSYDSRVRSPFRDREVASRGFGIRAPSVDARSSRESDFDRYKDYPVEPPLMIEAPPSTVSTRRDYPSEPREAPRDDRYAQSDWRDQERLRENDRDSSRATRESPPLRERDTPRDRDYPPREKERDYEDSRRERDRDREYRERDYDRYSEDDRYPRDRRVERDYDEDRREKVEKDKRDEKETRDYQTYEDHRDHPHTGAAVAGTAAASAAAYGTKEMYDKRHQDDVRDTRNADRDRRAPTEARDSRQVRAGAREGQMEDRHREDREYERPDREIDKNRRHEEDDDKERPRRRNYITKQQEAEAVERRDADPSSSSKHSEILDPEEDYRRRVQQQQQEISRSQGRREDKESESDVERKRREQAGVSDSSRYRDSRGGSDGHESASESQALTRYDTQDHEITQSPTSEEASENSDGKLKKKRVSIVVEPPKEKSKPKSILRKPTDRFPEDPNPIREGVAPLDKAKTTGDQSIPPTARWTKINRSMVNPEALEEKGERFEERQDHVIVLRVLTKDEVQKFANRTKEIRG